MDGNNLQNRSRDSASFPAECKTPIAIPTFEEFAHGLADLPFCLSTGPSWQRAFFKAQIAYVNMLRDIVVRVSA